MMFTAIVQHTPFWVWIVFVSLIVLGVRQSFERRLRPGRVTALPVVFVALSLAGVVTAFGADASGLPLALLLGIVAMRFAVAVLLALHPGLRGDAGFAALAGAGYGGFSGLFLGRAMALWQLARAPRTGVLRDA